MNMYFDREGLKLYKNHILWTKEEFDCNCLEIFGLCGSIDTRFRNVDRIKRELNQDSDENLVLYYSETDQCLYYKKTKINGFDILLIPFRFCLFLIQTIFLTSIFLIGLPIALIYNIKIEFN